MHAVRYKVEYLAKYIIYLLTYCISGLKWTHFVILCQMLSNSNFEILREQKKIIAVTGFYFCISLRE